MSDMRGDEEEEDDDDDAADVLLSLTNFGDSSDGLEFKLAEALGIRPVDIIIVEAEDDRVLFVVTNGHFHSIEELIKTLNSNSDNKWKCSVAEMEEEIQIDEEEAFDMWQNMNQESRTCHLKAVLSPDGESILPRHFPNNETAMDPEIVLQQHLKRDPQLYEFDNVRRIESLQCANWEEPFVLTANNTTTTGHSSTTRNHLLETLGDIQVRTGNRDTLVESGFDNSLPLTLSEALTRGSIVFTPVHELPKSFIESDLAPLLARFPKFHDNTTEQKYTLCLANQPGFGIGMHKHSAAFFYLLQGKKKWYMSASTNVTDPTHPGFYTLKSTHKCVQTAGEILYVPDEWFHEIFNLEYTAGLQALSSQSPKLSPS